MELERRQELHRVKIGPIQSVLPGVIGIEVALDGEIIRECQFETGYSSKGIEHLFSQKPTRAWIPFADHIDPEAAIFYELALCLAVEKNTRIEVPIRAQYIRIMICELTRISIHMKYLSSLARILDASNMFHYVMRDREKTLDLFELISGARFSLNFLRYGGVAMDITEGFLERVIEVCDLIRVRMKEYNDLFCFNYALVSRAINLAPLSVENATKFLVTGPNARAAGLNKDVRKDQSYSSYDKIDFAVSLGGGAQGVVGDTHDRIVVRLREIFQSLEVIRQVVDAMPLGPYANKSLTPELGLSENEVSVRVEGPRGEIECSVKKTATRGFVEFLTPSVGHLKALESVTIGARYEDLPLILNSFDISISEIDK